MQIRFGAMSPKLHEQLGLSEEETALEQRLARNDPMNIADPFTMLSEIFDMLGEPSLACKRRKSPTAARYNGKIKVWNG